MFYDCGAHACAQAQTASKRKHVREGACERAAASKRSIRLWASGPLKSRILRREEGRGYRALNSGPSVRLSVRGH